MTSTGLRPPVAATGLALLLLALSSSPGSGQVRADTDAAAPARAASDPELARRSGRELVRQLLDDSTRLAAFRELSRRKGREDLDDLRQPEVVVCPQGEGQEPLYLVLAEFLSAFHGTGHFDSDGLDELFPQESKKGHDARALRDELLIEVVTGDGELIDPFSGDNVLNTGAIMDLNGDGRIERVDHTSYDVDGVSDVDVLHVWPVQPRSQPTLSVLYNWGTDEWAYQLTDRDADGRVEIELGPRQAEGIKPKVVFAWDPGRQAYVTVAGTNGDHFRVLPTGNIWEQLDRLKADGLTFARDTEAVPEKTGVERLAVDQPWNAGNVPPRSQPYVYRSLRSLDDDAILRYMAHGASSRDGHDQLTATPPDFWSTPSRQAAAAFIEMNRSPAHRKAYALALDDRHGVSPPESGAIEIHGVSAPCYQARDWVWFLSVQPRGSYLVYGASFRAGTVFFDFVNTQPAFHLRYAPVADDDARHVLQTVWWLNRARTEARQGSAFFGDIHSTGDGRGRLTLRPADASPAIDVAGTLWGGSVSYRWSADMEASVLLNLAAYLVETALPERIGTEWQRQTIDGSRWTCQRPAASAASNARAHAMLARNAEQILDLYVPNGKGVPAALASLAVAALGDLPPQPASGRLEQLLATLPAKDPSVRDETTVECELRALKPLTDEAEASDSGPKHWEQWRALYDELDRVRYGFDEATGRERLRGALQLALRKVRTFDDPAALEQWAMKEEPGWRFALARLSALDRRAYVRALESWLGQTKDEDRRQVFATLAQADPERARALSADSSLGKDTDLAVASFSMLAKARAIPDEPQRVAALVALMIDPAVDWRERRRAVDVLVPADQPLRFNAAAVDEALLSLLQPGPNDSDGAYVVGPAAQALACRGRANAFEALLRAWRAREERSWGSNGVSDVLGALVMLSSQQGGPEQRQQLAEALRARLQQTHGLLTDVILAIWALDLRELALDLTRVATSSPDDVEGDQVNTWRSGPAEPVADRFHLARKVLAMWNEEDTFTRARLLVAFGLNEPALATPERTRQMKNALMTVAGALAKHKTERERLLRFVARVEESAASDGSGGPAGNATAVTRLVREAFSWPKAAAQPSSEIH
jgi:hypothetical protein